MTVTTVTAAKEEDLPAAAVLLGMLFAQEYEFEADPAKQLAGLRLVFDDPKSGLLLVLRDGEQVVGLANLLYVPSTALGGRTAILDDFIVHPGRRGEGLGDVLFAGVMSESRAAGCLRLTLQTDRDNVPAQKLYAKHGLMRSSMLIYKRDLRASQTPA